MISNFLLRVPCVAVRTLGHTGAARPRERRRTRKFTHEDEINVVVKLGFIGRERAPMKVSMNRGILGIEVCPSESAAETRPPRFPANPEGNRLQFKHQVRIIE